MNLMKSMRTWWGRGGAIAEVPGVQTGMPGAALVPESRNIGVDGALQISTIWACLDRRSSTVASLPCFVYEQKPNGEKVLARTNRLYALLHDQPNNRMTPFEFWRALLLNYDLRGNGYARIDRDNNGEALANLYPAGSGAGTASEITGWTQIAQIMDFTTSGGDQQFTNVSFLEQNFETQIPTTISAMSINIGIGDDSTLPGYQALKAASDARATRALRLQLPDGSFILYQGYVSFNETPTLGKGQVMQVKATFSLQSRPVRYTA